MVTTRSGRTKSAKVQKKSTKKSKFLPNELWREIAQFFHVVELVNQAVPDFKLMPQPLRGYFLARLARYHGNVPDEETDDYYQIDVIVTSRHPPESLGRELFIKWKNYPLSDGCWVLESAVKDSAPFLHSKWLKEHLANNVAMGTMTPAMRLTPQKVTSEMTNTKMSSEETSDEDYAGPGPSTSKKQKRKKKAARKIAMPDVVAPFAPVVVLQDMVMSPQHLVIDEDIDAFEYLEMSAAPAPTAAAAAAASEETSDEDYAGPGPSTSKKQKRKKKAARKIAMPDVVAPFAPVVVLQDMVMSPQHLVVDEDIDAVEYLEMSAAPAPTVVAAAAVPPMEVIIANNLLIHAGYEYILNKRKTKPPHPGLPNSGGHHYDCRRLNCRTTAPGRCTASLTLWWNTQIIKRHPGPHMPL